MRFIRKDPCKNCSENSKTILLFEVSALPYNQLIWQQLDKTNTDFTCLEKIIILCTAIKVAFIMIDDL